MDSVREIAIIFCSAAVLSGAASLIGAQRSNKSIKYITALILLTSIVTGIVKADWDFDFPDYVEAESTEVSTEIDLCEYQAEYMIREILEKNAVEYKDILVEATKLDDSSIIINQITVKGADNKEKAAELLASLGIDCRVVFG